MSESADVEAQDQRQATYIRPAIGRDLMQHVRNLLSLDHWVARRSAGLRSTDLERFACFLRFLALGFNGDKTIPVRVSISTNMT